MLKGLVTLTNSVICPLSYNCVCLGCLGEAQHDGSPGTSSLVASPAPLPGAFCTIAVPGYREADQEWPPCSPLSLGGGDRKEGYPPLPTEQVLSPATKLQPSVPRHQTLPPLTSHTHPVPDLLPPSIEISPSPLPEEHVLSA